jgi:transaldolase
MTESKSQATAALHAAGQSLWLDNITRGLLDKGTLKSYIERFSVTGLTSNPTIFDQAIGKSDFYDKSIADKAQRKMKSEEIFFELAIEDLSRAAALFHDVWESTNHEDGYVSLEVSPLLADDAEGTAREAKRLHALAKTPNLFIKIPGTPAGTKAIEEAIFAGVPVNVTLLFSVEQYLASAEAYLRGIERRVAAGLDPKIASVASLFVSRWDKIVADKVPSAPKNRLGIAVSKAAYKAYCDLIASPRWQTLVKAGAIPQRLLFASTGVKDPALDEGYYIAALAAPNTVNTMPEKTLLAFAESGKVGAVIPVDGGDAEAELAVFKKAGADLDALAAQLQSEAKKSFNDSWEHLMKVVDEKSHALKGEAA